MVKQNSMTRARNLLTSSIHIIKRKHIRQTIIRYIDNQSLMSHSIVYDMIWVNADLYFFLFFIKSLKKVLNLIY